MWRLRPCLSGEARCLHLPVPLSSFLVPLPPGWCPFLPGTCHPIGHRVPSQQPVSLEPTVVTQATPFMYPTPPWFLLVLHTPLWSGWGAHLFLSHVIGSAALAGKPLLSARVAPLASALNCSHKHLCVQAIRSRAKDGLFPRVPNRE